MEKKLVESNFTYLSTCDAAQTVSDFKLIMNPSASFTWLDLPKYLDNILSLLSVLSIMACIFIIYLYKSKELRNQYPGILILILAIVQFAL